MYTPLPFCYLGISFEFGALFFFRLSCHIALRTGTKYRDGDYRLQSPFGPVRHEPAHAALIFKIRKRVIYFIFEIFHNFLRKTRHSAVQCDRAGSARHMQFNAANRFIPRFFSFSINYSSRKI